MHTMILYCKLLSIKNLHVQDYFQLVHPQAWKGSLFFPLWLHVWYMYMSCLSLLFECTITYYTNSKMITLIVKFTVHEFFWFAYLSAISNCFSYIYKNLQESRAWSCYHL